MPRMLFSLHTHFVYCIIGVCLQYLLFYIHTATAVMHQNSSRLSAYFYIFIIIKYNVHWDLNYNPPSPVWMVAISLFYI